MLPKHHSTLCSVKNLNTHKHVQCDQGALLIAVIGQGSTHRQTVEINDSRQGTNTGSGYCKRSHNHRKSVAAKRKVVLSSWSNCNSISVIDCCLEGTIKSDTDKTVDGHNG